MIFRKAVLKDIPEIKALYSSAKGRKFCTWDEDYPGDTEISGDLNSGNLFVLEDNMKVAGAVSIVEKNELDSLPCWKNCSCCGEFARLVMHSDYTGRHLSGMLVDGVTGQLAARGLKHAHIAVAKDNIPARALYAGKGFQIRGEAHMYGIDFFLCEKDL